MGLCADLADPVSLLLGNYKQFTKIRNLGVASQNEILNKLRSMERRAMTYAYSIIICILGGLLLTYGLLCIRTGNPELLPYRKKTAEREWKINNHVRSVGKIVVLTAAAPFISAIIGLFVPPSVSPWPVLISLFGGMGVAILFGVGQRVMK